MIPSRWQNQCLTKPLSKLLFKGQRLCTHILLKSCVWFSKIQLTGVQHPTSQISYSLKTGWIKSKEPVIKEARSCKDFLSDGKEDKMVTSVPSGNLLFFPGCSTQPRLKSLQEILPAPITSQVLCYPPPQHKQGKVLLPQGTETTEWRTAVGVTAAHAELPGPFQFNCGVLWHPRLHSLRQAGGALGGCTKSKSPTVSSHWIAERKICFILHAVTLEIRKSLLHVRHTPQYKQK